MDVKKSNEVEEEMLRADGTGEVRETSSNISKSSKGSMPPSTKRVKRSNSNSCFAFAKTGQGFYAAFDKASQTQQQ
jgi:hypothetical protein